MIDVETVRKNGIYIGDFKLCGESIVYNRASGLGRNNVIALGDIVYFMIVNNKIYKIGKAGGATGFAGRAGTYARGRKGDATNNRIMDIMENLGENIIQIYCVQVPRPVVEYKCPLTNKIIKLEVSIHKDIESTYTDMFLDIPENDLPFCRQLS